MKPSTIQAFFLALILSLTMVVKAQPLSDELRKKVVAEISLPKTDFSVNLNVSLDDLQPSKMPVWKKNPTQYPESVDSLWDYILHNADTKSIPYVRLAGKLRELGRTEEASEVMNKGLQRISQALDKDPTNMELGDNAAAIFSYAGEPNQNLGLWQILVNANPDNAYPWASLAFWEGLMGDLERAQEHIEKAYSLNPNEPQVYVAEFVRVLFGSIISMGDADEDNLKVLSHFNLEFLTDAVKDNPKSEPVQLAYHSIRTMGVFWQVTMDNTKRFEMEEPGKLVISEDLERILAETKAYCKTKVKGVAYPILPLKLLLMDAVLHGEEKAALQYYQSILKENPKDTEVHRILGMMYFPPVKLDKVAEYMEADLKVNSSSGGYLALARVRLAQDKVNEATAALDKANDLGLASGLKNTVLAAYYWTKDKLQEGNSCWQKARSEGISDSFAEWTYFQALFQLLSGEMEEAKAALTLAADKGDFTRSSKAILELIQ